MSNRTHHHRRPRGDRRAWSQTQTPVRGARACDCCHRPIAPGEAARYLILGPAGTDLFRGGRTTIYGHACCVDSVAEHLAADHGAEDLGHVDLSET